jgi:hypothetical protein
MQPRRRKEVWKEGESGAYRHAIATEIARREKAEGLWKKYIE